MWILAGQTRWKEQLFDNDEHTFWPLSLAQNTIWNKRSPMQKYGNSECMSQSKDLQM